MLLEEAEVEVRATMLGSRDSASALLSGEIEAAFMVTSPSSPVVQQLLRAPGVQLLDLRRAEAFSMHLRFLEVLTLVEGSVDLSENLPPEETRMLAATATLVARNDLHPALNALLLEVAQEIHHEGGLLEPSAPTPPQITSTCLSRRTRPGTTSTGPPS